MTVARSLPSSLAPLVEELEVDQPKVVTVPLLSEIVARTAVGPVSDDQVRRIAYRLQNHGWLGSLRTRDAWEFQPGARAGAYGSGDRLIELRAQLAVNPDLTVVLAMESAALLLGYAQRIPKVEVLSCPATMALPRALSEWRPVHITFPAVPTQIRDLLPVWSTEELIVGIAIRPSAYRDRPGLAQWIPEVGRDIDRDRLQQCLAATNNAAWQRCVYLLRLAHRSDLAADLVDQRPPRSPVWFGSTRSGGVHDPVANVSDADLAPYLSAGTGA